jgi:signal peptidase I
MDIDFALVLVNLSFVTGVIYLIDVLFLAPKRKERVASFEVADKEHDKAHEKTREVLEKEPLFVEYAKSLFPVFFLVLLFRSFVAEPFMIPSESMLPTLKVGDYIVVNKFAYGFRLPVLGTKVKSMDEPERGDVMVFKYPHNPKVNYIKRVVGLPGDKIRYQNKRLYINGEKVEEVLLSKDKELSYSEARQYQENLLGLEHMVQKRFGVRARLSSQEWEIPEGEYFVMGDNRDNSNDSRFWGTVPDELVMGRAYAIWMHKLPGLHLPSFSRNSVIK